MDKKNILKEIKGFLDGYNDELKYVVNVETNSKNDYAECIVHEPNKDKKIIHKRFTSFMYMKDLSKNGICLYPGNTAEFIRSKEIKYGIKITKLQTGNQKRLVNGYCYKISTTKTYNDILSYLRDGGIDPYNKLVDDMGNVIKDVMGNPVMPNKHLFYALGLTDQFFISTGVRLFKGIDEYKDIHRLTFDIETTGLRYQLSRIIKIGVRDNRGFETILDVAVENDDEAERNVIEDFFNLIDYLNPAIIAGYNSESFDFDYILGRAKILKLDLTKIKTTLKEGVTLSRRNNVSFKHGNNSDKYTATQMWGRSIIDILHATKRTAAINSEIKSNKLKYIASYEEIAKPDRTHIKGDTIGTMFKDNKIHLANKNNDYNELPDEFQEIGKKLYMLQSNRDKLDDVNYKKLRNTYLASNPEFVEWYRKQPNDMVYFLSGKKIVNNYLFDDLWETERVDELYNQSSFMLAKIIPTNFHRVCTMGTAAVWNLLLTTWSYENDIAIPTPDTSREFSGGLARCYKMGYKKRVKKIDFASLYPMIQLSEDVFPIFDITGVIKKMLLYLTTTRNIYKKLANSDELSDDEKTLFAEIDNESYVKYVNDTLTKEDRAMFKIKQLPVKILNNSLFGALGSAIAFKWSDNRCSSWITCAGRIHLRHAIDFFSRYGCIALQAVTDGINFHYPEFTTIKVTENQVLFGQSEGKIEDMWNYGGKSGMDALIVKFNKEEMKSSYMSVDDDGDAIATFNISRINYANLVEKKNKKTGEITEKVKLTGNTLKSKIMPEYIEEFIDNGLTMILHGKGSDFINYYYDYCEDIRNCNIPLKKIASKHKVNKTIDEYIKRGNDKNGKPKAKQAFMELLLESRNHMIDELFEKHKHEFDLGKNKRELTTKEKLKYVSLYMPPDPEMDSLIYYVNNGYKISDGDSKRIIDKKTGVERFSSIIINTQDMLDNPDMKGSYNYHKYLAAFNTRVKTLLIAFNPEIRDKIIVKINKKDGDKLVKQLFTMEELKLDCYDLDDYDESMYLEQKEVKFWNESGIDPRKIWDGFKVHDNMKIHYDIYEDALNYLNEKMIQVNKPLIKSVNDKLQPDDLVLIKNGSEYTLGQYNGTFINIIRENVEVPKSTYDIEQENIALEKKRIVDELMLKSPLTDGKTEIELFDESEANKFQKYLTKFKETFKIPQSYTLEDIKNNYYGVEDVLKTFITDLQSMDNIDDVSEYGVYDFDVE